MKHSSVLSETFEFNLGQADNLRCQSTNGTDKENSEPVNTCQKCETCHLKYVLDHTKQWFYRAGDESQRRFLLGLMRRVQCVGLLQNIEQMLRPLSSKDSVYARSRVRPALTTDSMCATADRCLASLELEEVFQNVFSWFQMANYWTKSNFLLAIMNNCKAHQLQGAANLARTLLTSNQQVVSPSFYPYENTSLVNNENCVYSKAEQTNNSVNSDSKENEINSDFSFMDSVFCVSPSSDKAASGVACWIDFIRQLPVHLSKFIVNFLDEKSLNQALRVSRHWRNVIKEVMTESIVNQQVKEGVMLMQGSSANCVNPNYATDTDVPVPNLMNDSLKVCFTSEETVCQLQNGHLFKTECNFPSAYRGVSTRMVIMEERNVYCGPYNVFVLKTFEDSQRVIHTDGGQYLAVGSADRQVRFIDVINGIDSGVVIHGHAGSIKALYLCHQRGFVLSGSYDTSIRRWDVKLATCQKIYRGHMGTVCSIDLNKDQFATGSTDCTCKVWHLEQCKSIRTFKHNRPVSAVALTDRIVVSGDESGKVKVWDIRASNLIKTLEGHSDVINVIRFDRWHIVTGSNDGYALVWSAVGQHTACLAALRHPKPVLCVEFMFMRVLTGSEDGRLRIWNILNGYCCRIMRGNSRSDPILHLTAVDNQILVNTKSNILALNFEPVIWNYSLQDDHVASLIKYSHYCDAPIRVQPHSYVRAQRLRIAGGADPRLLSRNGIPPQVGRTADLDGLDEISERPWSAVTCQPRCSIRPRSRASSSTSKQSSRPSSSEVIQRISTTEEEAPQLQMKDKDTSKQLKSQQTAQDLCGMRRLSWGFERPPVAETSEPPSSLHEMKNLLRSQLRASPNQACTITPDFLRQTVASLRESQSAQDEAGQTRRQNLALQRVKAPRPKSGPSRVDPRLKIGVSDVTRVLMAPTHQLENENQVVKTNEERTPDVEITPSQQQFTTSFNCVTLHQKNTESLHSKTIRTTIPQPQLLRLKTATEVDKRKRTKSAIECTSVKIKKGLGTSASPQTGEMIPMLMYPKGMLDFLKQKRLDAQMRQRERERANSPAISNVPFGIVAEKFILRTYQQDEKYVRTVQAAFQADHQLTDQRDEDLRRQRWLSSVTFNTKNEKIKKRPKSSTVCFRT